MSSAYIKLRNWKSRRRKSWSRSYPALNQASMSESQCLPKALSHEPLKTKLVWINFMLTQASQIFEVSCLRVREDIEIPKESQFLFSFFLFLDKKSNFSDARPNSWANLCILLFLKNPGRGAFKLPVWFFSVDSVHITLAYKMLSGQLSVSEASGMDKCLTRD